MKKGFRFFTVSLLSAMTSASIYNTNKAINISATIKDLLHTKSMNFYSWKYGKVHYSVNGSGSPLLLIHDVHPASSVHEWDALISLLSETHTVYCIDLPGCGCSDRPKLTYTNYFYVQLLCDFISDVIGEKTDIVTSGLSNSIAVMSTKKDFSLIGRILMINPVDLAELNRIPDRKSKIMKKLLELPLIGSLVYNMIMARTNIDLLFTEQYFYNPFQKHDELEDMYYESAHLANGRGKFLLSSLSGNYVNFNIIPALKSMTQDICLVEGSYERNAQSTVALYESLISDLKCEWIADTKHLPHVEKPEKTAEIIKNFFQI